MAAGLIALIVPATKNLEIINPDKKRERTITLDRFLP
jgi:hypothetical protein